MKAEKKTALARIRGTQAESLGEDTRGLSTVEYLILLVVIAVASISIWKQIGGKVKGHAETSNTSIGTLGTP